MQPRYDLPDMHREVEGVHLGKLLKQINLRLAYVLDLDHCIGHAYLMKVQSLTDLRQAFHQQLIPLLQEFFFDDSSRVDLVLSTSTGAPFVIQPVLRFGQVFGKARADGVAPERSQFQLTAPESWTADTFRGVYSDLED
jgi:5-methylcytosine-specific restriction protein B